MAERTCRQGDPQVDASADALPPVRVLLPDGRVTGQLARRWQTRAGTWVYRIALRGWSSRAASTGQDLAEDLIEIDVPSAYVRPVPGISYDAVPVLRASQAPAPQAGDESLSGDVPESWVGEELKAAAGDPEGRGLGVRFHVPGCWAIQGRLGGTLTTAQARHMVRTDLIAQACDVCGADKALARGE
ncbi:hypothetical protein GCM10011583_74730 [Streptomyces camponoticapitis]|uniref:Uncharacterized protein n=1 Tax=Streptomyces camponoticapitis TaxID=1616125 RepID=A0ABQ2F1K8_9ACTN|nr:DUF6233 domain-containing protein [Streptomyces camponoticapitis]GGK32016.1 hypothetical protein GCM10011583_74730 [Streptomyces camponoticapitis]